MVPLGPKTNDPMNFISELLPALGLLLGAIGVLTFTIFLLVKHDRNRI